jgi:hypothetical protein
VLLIFGAIVTVFFTTWVNFFIDNVSPSLYQQVYRHPLVHSNVHLTESEHWASRSVGVWRDADGLPLEGDGSSWKHTPINTTLYPRQPDVSFLQCMLFMECFGVTEWYTGFFDPAFFMYEPLRLLLWCLLKNEVLVVVTLLQAI